MSSVGSQRRFTLVAVVVSISALATLICAVVSVALMFLGLLGVEGSWDNGIAIGILGIIIAASGFGAAQVLARVPSE